MLLRCALAAGLLVVAGCAAPEVGAPPETATDAPAPAPSGDLAALKKQAGIADCPPSDPEVAAVPGGLPDVTLPCLGGGRSVRLAGLRGRPLMVNVWAQWCGPCRQEAPFIADVATTNRSALVVLGIDHADPRPDLAIEFAQFATWQFPQIADPDIVLRSALQVAGPPQTFFIRPDGTIAYRHTGPFSSADQIRALAQQHLGVSP